MADDAVSPENQFNALEFRDRSGTRILILLAVALGVTRVLFVGPSGDHGIITDWAQKYLETGEFIQFELNGYLVFFKPIVFLLSLVIDLFGSSPVAVLAPNLILVALLVFVLWKLISTSAQPGWTEISPWIVLLALSLVRMYWPRPEFLALLMILVFACYFEADKIDNRRLAFLNGLSALSVSIHPIFAAYPLYFVYLLVKRGQIVPYVKFLVIRPFWGLAVVASCGLAIFFIIGASIEVWLDGLHRNWQDPAHSARSYISEVSRYLHFASYLPILLTLPLAFTGLLHWKVLWRRFDYLHHFALGYAVFLVFQPATWAGYLVPVVPLLAVYVARGYRTLVEGNRLWVVAWLALAYGGVAIASQISYKTFRPTAPDIAYVAGIACIVLAAFLRLRVKSVVILLTFLTCTYWINFSYWPYDLTKVNELIAGKRVMSTVRFLPFHLPPKTTFWRFEILNRRYKIQNMDRIATICRETDYVLLRDKDLVSIEVSPWHPLANEIVTSAPKVMTGYSIFLRQNFHLYQMHPGIRCDLPGTGD